jgi:hypothetical protein
LKTRIREQVFADKIIPEILLRENIRRIDNFSGKQQLMKRDEADHEESAES